MNQESVIMIICRHFANSLPATESLSQVYKLKNQTYIEQCQRQLKILKLYYGDHLQLPIENVSLLQLPLWIHARSFDCFFCQILCPYPSASTSESEYLHKVRWKTVLIYVTTQAWNMSQKLDHNIFKITISL